MLALLLQYRYLILLPIAIVEGPIITVIAAFLASTGVLNIYLVYIIGVMGDILGDAIYYWIGRAGRNTIIPKYGKYVGITEEKIAHAESHYKNHLWKTILFGKITQAPILIIIVLAGITKTDFKKFLFVISIVTLPKVLFFSLIGFYAGKSYEAIGRGLDISIIVGWAVIVLMYFIYKVVKHNDNTKKIS